MPILFAILLLLLPAALPAQPAIDADADSLVLEYEDLFDTTLVASPGLENRTESDPMLEQRPSGWAPELQSTFRRRDLLGLYDSPPVLLNYDRADGLFLGIGGNTPAKLFESRRVQGYFGLGYAFGSHYWQVYGGLKKDFLSPETPLRIGAEGHILTDTRDAWKMERLENTLFALLAGVDTRDYYQRRGFSASAQWFLSPRIALKGEYRHDNYRSSRREAGWSLFGPRQPFQEVPPVREGRMGSFVASILIDYMALRSWDDPQIGFEAQAEFGSLGGTFAQYTADARLKFTAVDRHLWLALRGRIGITTGDAPPQKLATIGGLGTLPGYPQNFLAGNRLLLLQSDILVAPIRTFGLRVILENNIAYAGMSDSSAGIFEGFPEEISDLKYSTGLYLGTATGRFRIGFAFRTDIFADPEFTVRLTQPF